MEETREHSAVEFDGSLSLADPPTPDVRGRTRLNGFAYHLGGYFVIAAICAAINLSLTPESTWSLLPIIGWSPLLTLHAAYAMGFFDIFKRR